MSSSDSGDEDLRQRFGDLYEETESLHGEETTTTLARADRTEDALVPDGTRVNVDANQMLQGVRDSALARNAYAVGSKNMKLLRAEPENNVKMLNANV